MKRLVFISVLVMLGTIFLFVNEESKKASIQNPTPSPEVKSTPYILKAGEGEKLGDPRGGIIKVSPQTGAKNYSMVMQPLAKTQKINVHMHDHDEEVFFVHKGKGTVFLNDQPTAVEEGSVVFIPAGTWHGFEANEDMQLIWVISPPHFVDLFRRFYTPGLQPTKEDEAALFQKYGFKRKPVK